jgi:CheY-like chemotaxis protein
MLVLVVDDEESVCSSIADYLRQEGFDVAEACDGLCALEIAREQGINLAAVLTDVNMPQMNGIEMWKRMKPLVSPDCKVLFMSGLAQTYLTDGSKFPGELLPKPFLFSVLLSKLGQAA